MNKDHILVGFLWILYCTLHSILASSRVKKVLQETLKLNTLSYRLFYNVFAFITLLGLTIYHLSIDSFTVFNLPFWNRTIGILLIFPGLVIMILCIVKYFQQMIGISSIKKDQFLQITGLHRYVRHPLYLGTFIFLTGLFFIYPFMTNGIAVTIIIIYTIIAIRFEEMKLIKQFGDEYKAYKKKVSMLIPFLK